jgi:taurine dioxygenase
MRVTNLTPRLGSRVEDIDLTGELSTEESDVLRELFRERHVLTFTEPRLTAEDQLRFVSTFLPVSKQLSGEPITYVSNIREDGIGAADRLRFHADYTFSPFPISAICLFGEIVDGPIAPTIYVDLPSATEQLPADLRERVKDRSVLMVADFRLKREYGLRHRLAELGPNPSRRDYPREVHPVLYTDPYSGQEIVIASEQLADSILGLSPDDSEAVLSELWEVLYRPENLYTHHWHPGDLVIWNNVALQHGRPAFTQEAKRSLRRIVAAPYHLQDIMRAVERSVA